jgi:hypothetical protein
LLTTLIMNIAEQVTVSALTPASANPSAAFNCGATSPLVDRDDQDVSKAVADYRLL